MHFTPPTLSLYSFIFVGGGRMPEFNQRSLKSSLLNLEFYGVYSNTVQSWLKINGDRGLVLTFKKFSCKKGVGN
jgi:hypothetical protein